jgi:hypothetical protein
MRREPKGHRRSKAFRYLVFWMWTHAGRASGETLNLKSTEGASLECQMNLSGKRTGGKLLQLCNSKPPPKF